MYLKLNKRRREAGFLSYIPTLISTASSAYSAYQDFSSPHPPSMGAGPATGPMLSTSPMLPTMAMMQTMPLTMGSTGQALPMMRLIATSFGLVSRAKAGRTLLAIAKYVGLQGAANALGLALNDAIGLIFGRTMRRRRSRGISARSLRITRRTTRQLIRAHADLRQLCGGVSHHRSYRKRRR